MKILYAVQGTGNGHLSRALDIIPILKQRAEVDILVSGCQADVSLPYAVQHQFKGLSFIFGKKGGVDFVKTFSKLNSRAFYQEMRQLAIESYDLVLNDFEPISAWACYFKKKTCIALSHQSAVLAPQAPRPKKEDAFGKFVLKNYAPATHHYGFHFNRFGENIFTPVIRSQIRELIPENQGHITVYLPAYDDWQLIEKLKSFKEVNWQVFSKHNKMPFRHKHIQVNPINNVAFVQSLATCAGVLCGAGFETPAEALYLGKKVLAIPMKGQYEQQCNAAALKVMGVPVIPSLKTKHLPVVEEWLENGAVIPVNYPNETEQIIDKILQKHAAGTYPENFPIQTPKTDVPVDFKV
ncbi:glycosyl transferase [Adhaeribacter arboris]|uniref:Glycosyl transferase n=1 Tax=Adhaeribacter arboris TaxID=2072846 RepID=A0A2T2YJE4_9BACT|nr:glycosyltransferase family protein [Adhaeribacter arboris]PSR55627.1 glycosyl transferase [Adhaeribacter arboris]